MSLERRPFLSIFRLSEFQRFKPGLVGQQWTALSLPRRFSQQLGDLCFNVYCTALAPMGLADIARTQSTLLVNKIKGGPVAVV